MNDYVLRSTLRRDRRKSRMFHAKSRKISARAKAKEVTMIRYYMHNQTGYYVCPGCNITFEREYQAYCDRCGQKLAWNMLNKGKIVSVRRIACTAKRKEPVIQEGKKTETLQTRL